jgi:putative transcriptional regulator
MEKTKFNKKFGLFVAMKRSEWKLTQSQLAAQMGNNAQNISRLERGEVSPTLYWLNNLAKVFEIPLSEMIKEFETFK